MSWHVQRLMLGGEVDRLHCAPMRAQTVAAHSWGVAMIIQRVWPACRKELILAALQHDLGEQEVGDIPAPAKWRAPEAYAAFANAEGEASRAMGFTDFESALTPLERRVLKLADGLELLALTRNRLNNGEVGARIVYRNILNHLQLSQTNVGTGIAGCEEGYDVAVQLYALEAEIIAWSAYLDAEEMQEPK